MKVITAIGDSIINNRLKEIDEFEVIGNDILYEEGIIEILEEKKDIDMVILSNNLPKEFEFYTLINKIKKIKDNIEIIVFLKEKEQYIENFLNSNNIFKIFYLNEIEDFFESLKFSFFNKNKKDELNKFKDIISKSITDKGINSFLENEKKDENYEIIIGLREGLKNYKKGIHKTGSFSKTIVLSGVPGCGKSIVSIILSNYISLKSKRVLLVDFDFLNSTISKSYNLNNYEKKIIENISIIRINKFMDLIEGNEIFSMNKYNLIAEKNMEKISLYESNEKIKKLKSIYDCIIIDINNHEKEIIKCVLKYVDIMIFLVEPNLSEVRKSKSLLEIYVNDLNVNFEKIKIVLNKSSKYKINNRILEEIFEKFEIIGEIEYDEKYNLFINKNLERITQKKEYEKIYKNIKGG